LTGGAASAFGDEFECWTGREVLTRIRASLRRPATLERNRFGQLATSVPVRKATIAVLTPTGKRLALLTVSESGKARLFVAPTCTRD
jgi:hypothetical protein